MLGSYICKLMWSGRAYICDDLIMTGRKYKLQKKRYINNNKGEENIIFYWRSYYCGSIDLLYI